MTPHNLFEGDDGRRRLIDALAEQKFVGGSRVVAEELAGCVEVKLVAVGTKIIEQDDAEDKSLFMILSGAFDVEVYGKAIARRFPSEAVGEMAAILPSQHRSATVIAVEKSWVAKVAEPDLARLADKHPLIWRFFAKELARRLLARNKLLTAPRPKIRVLIISSAEALDVARASISVRA